MTRGWSPGLHRYLLSRGRLHGGNHLHHKSSPAEDLVLRPHLCPLAQCQSQSVNMTSKRCSFHCWNLLHEHHVCEHPDKQAADYQRCSNAGRHFSVIARTENGKQLTAHWRTHTHAHAHSFTPTLHILQFALYVLSSLSHRLASQRHFKLMSRRPRGATSRHSGLDLGPRARPGPLEISPWSAAQWAKIINIFLSQQLSDLADVVAFSFFFTWIVNCSVLWAGRWE